MKTMGRNAKLKEKQKWCEEMIHLDNARKLRGIYFIDPEDTEFKETIKNVRFKLETSVAPAMPCKIIMKNCGSGASNKIQTKLAYILEADESTGMRRIQANHDRQKLNEMIESKEEEICRARQGDELHRRDQQLFHEQVLKQNSELREAHHKSLNGRIEEVSEFHIRHYCKTKISRGSGYCSGTYWKDTRIAE